MLNRRTFVAMTACLLLTATTALAGGGSKKDSTITVNNETGNAAFVFVDVEDQRILNAYTGNVSGGAQAVINAFNKLGGKQIASGGSHDFKVKAGDHTVTAIDIESEFSNPLDAVIGMEDVTTAKGETKEITFGGSSSSN